MARMADFIALCNRALGRFAASPLTAQSATDTNEVDVARLGANGGLEVEFPAGATAPLPADAATQTTLAALNALATTPTTPTAITPSDDTDTSTITAKGLVVSVAGDLAIRGTGAPTTTVTITVVAGQYVPWQCSRVMAATTATVVGAS